ncbi:MAG: hypothetical protein V4587_09610 [Acidobacteriota bacterium]
MAELPTFIVYPAVMNMSPSGDLFAVGGDSNYPEATITTSPPTAGLQIFHFNGANPITPGGGTLTTVSIDEIHWDNSDHLYALSNSTGKLYVYTVTPTGITAVPGSLYSFTTPNTLIVVPTITTSCSAPAADGVKICAPTVVPR